MARPTILVVDDPKPTLDLIVKVLRAAGYAPEAVADGVAAAVAIRSGGYDLVIRDIMMPDLQSTALLRLMKAESPSEGRLRQRQRASPEDPGDRRPGPSSRSGLGLAVERPQLIVTGLAGSTARPWTRRSRGCPRRPTDR